MLALVAVDHLLVDMPEHGCRCELQRALSDEHVRIEPHAIGTVSTRDALNAIHLVRIGRCRERSQGISQKRPRFRTGSDEKAVLPGCIWPEGVAGRRSSLS